MLSRITFIVITNASEKRLIDLSQTPVPIGRIIDQQSESFASTLSVPLNHLRFNSKVVSRNHARVVEKDGKIFLQDTKSSSGTFLNGMRISGPGLESDLREVKNGDIIRLGEDYNLDGVIHQAIVLKVILPIPRIQVQDGPPEQRQQQNSETIVYADDVLSLRSGIQQSPSTMGNMFNDAADVEASIESEFNGLWRTLTQDIPTPLDRLRRIQNQMQPNPKSRRNTDRSTSSLSSATTASSSSSQSRRASPVSSQKDNLPKIVEHAPTKNVLEGTAGKLMMSFRRKLSRERMPSSAFLTTSTPTLVSLTPSSADLANSSSDALLPDAGAISRTKSSGEVRRETPGQNLLQPSNNHRSTPQLGASKNPSTQNTPITADLSPTLVMHSTNSSKTSSASSVASNPRSATVDKGKNTIQPYPTSPVSSPSIELWEGNRLSPGLTAATSMKGGGISEHPSVEECCQFIEKLGTWPNIEVQTQILELAKQKDESVMELFTKYLHFPKAFVDMASQYANSRSET